MCLGPIYTIELTENDMKKMLKANKLESANTSVADYVWLPIDFVDGRPVIRWMDSWKLES